VNQPILQVVIPAYGESPYLYETLKSATNNLSLSTPILVLEDPSSSTNVGEVVKKFNDRVEYQVNPTRLGIAGNFNKAMEVSQGKFTLLCGSDDLILSDISNDLILLTNEKIAAVTSNSKVIDQNGREIRPLPDLIKSFIKPNLKIPQVYKNKNFFNRLMLGDWLYFPAIAWNTEIMRKEKFNEAFHTAMDLDVFVRLIDKEYEIYHFPITTFSYRRHPKSASSLYAYETGRFIEELNCHKNALEVAKNNGWRDSKFLAHLALTIRLHGFLKALSWFVRLRIKAGWKLMVISLTRLTSQRLEN
jgi:glycosyltransferase involved in cell wall biosynthesis